MMDNSMNAKLLRSVAVQVGDDPWDAWEYAGYDGLIDQVHFVERDARRRMKTVPFDQVKAVLDHDIVPFRTVWGAIMQIRWSQDAEHLQHPRPKPNPSRIPRKLPQFEDLDGRAPQSHWLDVLESKRDED